MENTAPSRVKLLNYGLVTFLVMLAGMVLAYKWFF